MMFVVTAATGQLGRLVVEQLLARVPADQVAVVVRDAAKAADLAALGVEVRIADHGDPAALAGVFGPGDRVLLISGNEFGTRIAQHAAVVDAATVAGVALLAYTGILGGPATRFTVADDHHVTERLIEDSGLPYTFLRNGWYTENYTGQLPGVLASGAVIGTTAPDSRLATASRADYAEAAAIVLVGPGHENATYELSGDTAWTLREYAAEVTRQSGTPVAYRPLPDADYAEILIGAGLPDFMAAVFADTENAIGRGELATVTGDLSRLLGRPTTPLADTIAAALAG
ncbi:NAD(P)H-binding protein [Embleya sp. NBC_00896]|uniref:NAD(P)H-binding protein n=1 Tax=Embleya sp. NBC_00896 TaxID=2975961 RepID=UPI00386D58CD|nr:NAD(P)H-binding protein [Embleya sp. NBC_00896]